MTTKKYGVYVLSGVLVEIVSVTGGWTTYKDNGEEKKARNSLIRPATPEDIAKAQAAKSPAPAPVKPAAPVVTPMFDKPKKSTGKPKTLETASGEKVVTHDSLVQPDYSRYVKHDIKSPSGRKALDINDKVADLLRGHDISDCHYIVAKNMAAVKGETRTADEIEKELVKQYQHLNVGMQRMNLGNRLRKILGTYGNLNAHKTQAKVSARQPESSHAPTAKDNQVVRVKRGSTITIKVDTRSNGNAHADAGKDSHPG